MKKINIILILFLLLSSNCFADSKRAKVLHGCKDSNNIEFDSVIGTVLGFAIGKQFHNNSTAKKINGENNHSITNNSKKSRNDCSKTKTH